MSGAHDAGGVMHVQSNVAIRRELWLARMQTYAHPDRHALGPGMAHQGTLDSHCCRNRIGGTSKSDKESVTLGVNLLAVILRERCAQQVPALRQHAGVPIAQLLQEA